MSYLDATAGAGVENCLFCGKGRKEVRTLIVGRPVHNSQRLASICDECIGLCVDILKERDARERKP